MSVVSLIPNSALAVDAKDIADRVRALADRIENGEFGQVERVVVLVDVLGQSMERRVYGRQCCHATLVGLLEYAKLAVIDGQ